MGARGRKSVASLGVVTIMPGQRPEPPDELTSEQAAEWRAIVGRMTPEWFTAETHPILSNLCRHIVAARHLSQMIDALPTITPSDDEGLKTLDKLMGMRDRETKAVTQLSTKLRLTPQSRWQPKSAEAHARRGVTANKPWHAEQKAG